MQWILHIETSAPLCSVALSEKGIFRDAAIGPGQNDHASQLAILTEQILQKNNIPIGSLSAIALSAGPGSYTGLRIGSSFAKGICHALQIPLIAINTLQAMAAGVLSLNTEPQILFAPLIDARRMEVYTAVYTSTLECVQQPEAIVMEHNDFSNLLQTNKIVFFGSGLAKIQHVLQHTNSVFIENFSLTAAHMIMPAWNNFTNGHFADIIDFEPEYIKTFSGLARIADSKS